jgi:hypothetical protein
MQGVCQKPTSDQFSSKSLELQQKGERIALNEIRWSRRLFNPNTHLYKV